MSSLFGRLKGKDASTSPQVGASPTKKKGPNGALTPLEQLLSEAGPLKTDGSDKFFGMHNPSNTCYCNSVVQCLFFSDRFRENVVKFPPNQAVYSERVREEKQAPDDTTDTPASPPAKDSGRSKLFIGSLSPSTNKKPTVTPLSPPQTKPEENKESFDYQKKQIMNAGPQIRMEKGYFEAYGMPESLFTGLKDIFESIIAHRSRMGVVNPSRFLEVLRQRNELFRSPQHQDAHEFLNLLLNDVVESVEAYSKNLALPIKQGAANAGISVQEGAEIAQAQQPSLVQGTGSNSWVHELFEGTLTSETKCLTCESVSQRDEVFLDLSVDLENHTSVTACLRKFSEEEMLCEGNKFHCDKCNGLQEAEKRMKIKRLPRILALHLKRFKYIEDQGIMKKLFHRVVYPFYLRLWNTTDDAEDPDRLYELYAVLVHLGSTPFHGHYVSIIKTQERGWLLFDDELVLPVGREYVRNFFGGERSPAAAYVLFYQETTEEAMRREQEHERPASAASEAMDEIVTPTTENPPPILPFDPLKTPTAQNGDYFPPLTHAVTAPAATTPPVPTPVATPEMAKATRARSPTTIPANGSKNNSYPVGLGIREALADEQENLGSGKRELSNGDEVTNAAGLKSPNKNFFRGGSLSMRQKSKFFSSKERGQSPASPEMQASGSDDRPVSPNLERGDDQTDKLEKKISRFTLGKKRSSLLQKTK